MSDPDPLNQRSRVHASAFIASSADLIGAVTIGEEASIWYATVLRADIDQIEIGPRSNIQDGCVVHLERGQGTHVGQYVTVGHKAILHACMVDDEVLVGMGAIVMDGVEIGSRSIIGAGALVTMGSKIPPGSLVLGSPAKVVRALSNKEQKSLKGWADNYVRLSRRYLAKGIK
ncbi:MAG: gamma carbonic anhydrase family protein [Verrucomicrobiales bacterium]|jgi:carbonic anhydrase/acetyltransferase-like protein (isoleucine patch superfamily)